jgi:CheY-like chemotaxis protein
VLTVDDDPLVLTNTCALLEELGHSVLRATSAEEAQRMLRQDPGIEMLLTDHVMPHMSGAQLVEIVAHEHPHLPMILATGYAELATKLPAATVRLAKPFEQTALQEAIAEALQRKNLPL